MKLWPSLNSFRARLTVQWTLVFGALLALALVGIYFGMRRALLRTLEADLRTIAGTEVASATDGPRVHLHPLDEPAIVNEHYLEKFVQILTAEGAVVSQSSNLKERAPLVNAGAIREALAGRAAMTDVALNQAPGRSLSLLVTKGDERYVFVVAVPMSNVYGTLATLRLILVSAGLIVLAATALVGYRLATIALRPVDLMTQRAQLIGRDQLKARLAEPETDDELSRLAHVLNEMLDRLYQIIESHQRFAADASHELRSPLAILRGRLELALRRARSVEEYRAVVETCLSEVVRLTRLSEDLLELARSDAQRLDLDLTEVELQPLVAQEVARLLPEAESRNVTLTAQVNSDLTVIADETRLRRVLGNLLSNAVHYSKPEGGRVIVNAGNGAGDGDGEVWIEVCDDGIGLDVEHQQHVFERFWRADEARNVRSGGAGLGLAICREIVRAHGGRITFNSSPGRGSSFRICFPVRIDE